MTTQPIAPSRPAPGASGPARHRRIRTAAAITATVALIATGGYLATTTIGPDTASPPPATATNVNPNAPTLRELHQSIAGQYGNRPAPNAVVNPSTQVRRELHQSIAGQYSNQSAAASAVVNPNAQMRRELRENTAGQYGPGH
jgi:hypothetical protein